MTDLLESFLLIMNYSFYYKFSIFKAESQEVEGKKLRE